MTFSFKSLKNRFSVFLSSEISFLYNPSIFFHFMYFCLSCLESGKTDNRSNLILRSRQKARHSAFIIEKALDKTKKNDTDNLKSNNYNLICAIP